MGYTRGKGEGREGKRVISESGYDIWSKFWCSSGHVIDLASVRM